MITLDVALGERSYPIHIGRALLGDGNLFAPYLRGTSVVVVTNDLVGPLYAERLCATLRLLGKDITTITLPDGEVFKTSATLDRIYTGMLEARCDRKTTMFALGGGVVGDMTGFAAATYMRGVDFIQVPTTLLAQVDSSVGGKTGINHPLGKNMIGAFHQPRAVIADLATLDTLPDRELSAGLAEVIKHGAIIDREFFAWCEANMPRLLDRDEEALTHAVRRSCEIKSDVVRLDERESGLRAILNFGHTFGHAIEAGMGYGAWLHGEAVGAGMVLAARLSRQLGQLTAHEPDRIATLVGAAHLPIEAPRIGTGRFLELMAVDKKAEGGAVNYVILEALGKAAVRRVPAGEIDQLLRAAGQPG